MLRPRYRNLQNLTFSEASEYFTKLQIVDPILRHLDNQYFAHPFGSGHFHGNMQKSKTFTVKEYLTRKYEDLNLPHSITKATAEKYLIKNIFMQNCLKQEFADLFMERDRLEYVDFSPYRSPFDNWSKELKNTIAPWTLQTRVRFKDMANEVILRVCKSNTTLIITKKAFLKSMQASFLSSVFQGFVKTAMTSSALNNCSMRELDNWDT
jgi:hypothetical protein